MAIKKPELLLQSILSLDNNERADVALGLATVLTRLGELNDEETAKKLELLKKDCYKGLSLDECLEIYNRYREINPFKKIYIERLDIEIRLVDLKGAFRDIYYKIIDYVMNIDFGTDYAIGVKGEDDEELFDKLKRGLSGKNH